MVRARAQNGKFIRIEEENDFLKEFKRIFYNIYYFWKLLPLLLVVYFVWHMFDFSERFNSGLVIMACGKNYTCCSTTSNIKNPF
jgi:hypothetical protein